MSAQELRTGGEFTGTDAGTQRGAGHRRGRGSGRGRRGYSVSNSVRASSQASASNDAVTLEERSRPLRPRKPPLTHFLSLPIGHHAGLRDRISSFTNALLDASPAIPGLDRTVVIPPRRLHLTLGVMSLSKEDPAEDGLACESEKQSTARPPRALQAAITLLNELRPRLMEILGDEKLRLALRCMDIMKPDGGDLEKAHVMWAGPTHNGIESLKLKEIAHFLHKEFKQAGLLVDDRRPLKLHCTVLNTTHRKPRGRRAPFSYAAILESAAFKAIIEESSEVVTPSPSERMRANGRGPVSVDFGEWVIDEAQICEMGSWGPEGEYVCVARCPLN